MFFDDWNGLIRVVVIGILSYVSLIALLRLTGKRTLSKWNAFDFVVTIALGSTLATVLLSSEVSFAEGVVALAVLVFLQFGVALLASRASWFQALIKAEPTYVYLNGEFLVEQLKHERVTESEVRAAVRGVGVAGLSEVLAVVLETDGSVSVIKKSAAEDRSALSDVRRSSRV